MTKLIIDRKRWLRGKGSHNSYLLDPITNEMCCLGFFCRAVLNLSEAQFLRMKQPQEVARELFDTKTLPTALMPLVIAEATPRKYACSFLANQLMQTNDDLLIADEVRESRLRETFAEMGIEVTFVD